jgi:hypothetical protein
MKRYLPVLFLLVLFSALTAVPRDMVVVEIGTGTWCTYCPGAAMGADDLVANHHRAAIVEYHNGDNYTNNYSNARNTYYNITGYPTANFDGANPTVGGDHTTSLYPGYRTKVNNRLSVPSAYTISATGSHADNIYEVAVTVSRVEADTNTNLKLHGVLTESGIQYNWQGQTHLEFVERLMSPSELGTAIDFSTNTTQTINLTFTADAAWNAQNFEFVFFLQNNTTKEILQGCKYSVEALENVSPLDITGIDFGTVAQDGAYNATFTIHNWWTQDMNIDVTCNSQDYFVMEHVRDSYTIPFMEDKVFDVLFLPSQSGPSNATITITTDNPAYSNLAINLTADVIPTANEDDALLPMPDRIISTGPNPFRSITSIRYKLNPADRAELNIYNVKGARIYTAELTGNNAENSHIWNGSDNTGSICPAGIYFCSMNVNGKTVSSQKIVKLQ